jgi:hypothetical protein
MKTHYKKWLSIAFSGTVWEAFDAMINIRNCIAHGVGELTRRQARKNQHQLVAAFTQVGVEVRGTQAVFRPDALRICAAASTAFITWLDVELANYDRNTEHSPSR